MPTVNANRPEFYAQQLVFSADIPQACSISPNQSPADPVWPLKHINPSAVIKCRSLEEAFKDLRGLMAKAAEMVDLAERFRTTMAAQRKAAQQESAGAEQPDAEAQQWMDTEMQAELVNMGIASPVTKAESGARYHQQLSRQVQPHWQPTSKSC